MAQTFEVVCNGVIALAFLTIATVLLLYWRKKRNAMPYAVNYLMFAAFIGLCGASRAVQAVEFFAPVHGVYLVSLTLTAVVSAVVALVFPVIAKHQSELKTPQEYYDLLAENNRRRSTEQDVCVHINDIITSLEAEESWLQQEVEGGRSSDSYARLEAKRKQIQDARWTKSMLGVECQEGGGS